MPAVTVALDRPAAALVTLQRVFVMAWLAIALLVPEPAAAAAADPTEVVTAYETARKSGDTDAMLALFADNAVIVDRLGYSHSGRDELRRALEINSSRGRGLSFKDRRVSGDHVVWVELAATPSLTLTTTADAVVEDGRITRLGYRTDEGIQAEPPRVGTPLPAILGMTVPLVAAMLSLTVLYVATQPSAQPVQTGPGLLSRLRTWSQARRVGPIL